MRVLILGGYGLIGAHVAARLIAAGHEVVGLARDMAGTRRFPRVRWLRGDLARMTAPEDWAPLLDGVGAVVNCAGALQDNARDALSDVHVTGPMALYRACEARGIRRVIHVSAAGIDNADTAFARTKREAEQALKNTSVDWVILRPGLVMASAAYGGTALLRALAAFPFVVPVLQPDQVMQVVSADDVAETVVRALAADAPAHVTWELMHPERTTLRDVFMGYREWLGLKRAPMMRVPAFLARVTAWGADAIAWLGWRSPMRTTSLKQLAAGVTGDPAQWMRETGIAPKSLSDIFAHAPSGVQERWFARLYLLKPLGIFVIALFWLFSGIVALGPGFNAGEAFLIAGGMAPKLAWWSTFIGGWADIVLGSLVLFRRIHRLVLIAMILLCVVYLGAGSMLHPEFWLDPLGVYAKVVPIMLAMAMLAAIADER